MARQDILVPCLVSKLVTSMDPKGSYDENAPLVDFGQSKDINSHGAITPHKSFQRWPYSFIAVAEQFRVRYAT